MGTGKTTKYFKYAIGEIILVVLGILIALQINNWNEVRKNQQSVNISIAALLSDLKQDTLQLSNEIRGIDEDLNSCLLYTSPSPRDQRGSRMPSSA